VDVGWDSMWGSVGVEEGNISKTPVGVGQV